MKILIICDHYPLSPRVKKIRESLIKLYQEAEVKVVAWNRNNDNIKEDYVVSLNQKIGYGNTCKKFMNLYKFMKIVRKEIKLFKPTYIHAVDFEMLLIASLVVNRSKIIYEVYDIKFFSNKIVNKFRENIEKFIIKNRVDDIILASPYFEKYYISYGTGQKNIIILNNKPSINYIKNSRKGYMGNYENILKDKITVGFIGTIRYRNILLNLINAAKEIDSVVIFLVGSGPDYKYLLNYIENNNMKDKVVMTGRYEMRDLEEIYKSLDYIWGVYPNNDNNVKYAISNKFFESQLFNKEIIVANETFLGDEVVKKRLGYSISPYNLENIKKLLSQLEKKKNLDNTRVSDKKLYWEDEEEKLLKIYK